MLDSRRHRGIGRNQTDPPPRGGLHQCDAKVRPIRVAGGPSPTIATKPPVYGRNLQPVGGAQHHLQNRAARGHRPGRRQNPFGVICAVQSDRRGNHYRHAHCGQHRLIADTPDNINRCADSIAPAHNTIRSALR